MSYIKREAVLKIIGDNCPHDKGGYNTEEEMGAGAACYYIMKDVENIPTADVVEVVRCKDCKHNPKNGGECDRSITHTSRDYVCEVNTYRYIGIDYCSYGERREQNEESSNNKM